MALLAAVLSGRADASPRSEAARRLEQAEHQKAEQQRQQAEAARALSAAQARSARLAEQRAQAEAALKSVQQDVMAASAQLQQAQAAQDRAESALKERAAEFYAILPLMLRMARYPAETVLAIPAPPEQTLEGFLVAHGVAATLNRQAAYLRSQASKAASLRAETAQRSSVLAAQHARKVQAEAALDTAIGQAQSDISAAQADGQKAAQAVAALAEQAQNLRDAIAAMDAARAAAVARAAREAALADKHKQSAAAQVARAREAALARPATSGSVGRLSLPVSGSILRAFGAPALDGPSTGISYGTAPGAPVASPCSGRVAFAAPFRSYGRLIILECGGGYDVVLAGLGEIETTPGHPVRAGEALGRMPDSATSAGPRGGGRPILYLELRAKGQPVDPSPFLNAKG